MQFILLDQDECVHVCMCVRDGGGGVQLMSSITFLVSLLGRHGDRGGDLHRQRDQKRTEHVLCQEQGEYFLVFLFLLERRKVLRLVFSFGRRCFKLKDLKTKFFIRDDMIGDILSLLLSLSINLPVNFLIYCPTAWCRRNCRKSPQELKVQDDIFKCLVFSDPKISSLLSQKTKKSSKLSHFKAG